MDFTDNKRKSQAIQTPDKKRKNNGKRKTKRHIRPRIIKQYLETSRVAINHLAKKHKTMGKLNVFISWSGDNYCATAQGDELNGVVVVTNKTLDGVKQEFQSSLQFHIEGCLADGDKLPEWVVNGNYQLEYHFDTPALLHSLDGILTRSAIARVSGINEKQIGHYASGHRTPRQLQREKIINGIHKISRELAMVM